MNKEKPRYPIRAQIQAWMETIAVTVCIGTAGGLMIWLIKKVL